MKQLLLFLVILLISNAFPQTFKPKQITYMAGADCKNFSSPDPFNYNGLYVFEADFGNKTNIFLGKYDRMTDSFYVIRNMTDNNFRNVNPSIIRNDNDTAYYLVYQTNEKGNWDIAYRRFTEYYTSPPVYIAGTPADETNPRSSLFDTWLRPSNLIAYNISFISGPGVGVTSIDSTKPNVVLFNPSGDNHYYEPTMVPVNTINFNDLNLAVKVDSSDFNQYIVYREYRSGIWGEKKLLVKDTAWSLGANVVPYYNLAFTYSAKNKATGKYSIYAHVDFDTSRIELLGDAVYNYGDLHTGRSMIVTKSESIRNPFGYKASKDNRLNIVVPNKDVMNYWEVDSLMIPVKVNNSSLNVSRMGWHEPGEAFFTVWQDSINGHIQLFGKKTVQRISGINDKTIVNNFTLEQNYPNPFNPSTKIVFNLTAGAEVKLAVYNLLGELISVPVNEYLHAGNHEVVFNAKNLPGGVYFYELTSGSSRAARKMVLLK